MEKCPCHHIEPVIEHKTVREKISKEYKDKDGKSRKYILPELVMYRIYCPMCREHREDGSGIFNVSYVSRTRSSVISKWNSRCATENLKTFKRIVKTGL